MKALILIMVSMITVSASAQMCMDNPAAEKAAKDLLFKMIEPIGFPSGISSPTNDDTVATFHGMFRNLEDGAEMIYSYRITVKCNADGTAEAISGGYSGQGLEDVPYTDFK